MGSRFAWIGSVALGVLLVAAPQRAEAQQADGWWDWALSELVQVQRDDRGGIVLPRRPTVDPDGRRTERGDDDRDGGWWDGDDDRRERDDDDRARGRKGPKFCRTGAGHPVHGRAWCRDKGFGLGNDRVRWENRGWEDIILGTPRGSDRRRESVGQGGLMDVLGDVIFGRLDRERSRLGGTEPLVGRWYSPRDGVRVLQIRSGRLPVAELSDVNGDGRVDAVLVPRR